MYHPLAGLIYVDGMHVNDHKNTQPNKLDDVFKSTLAPPLATMVAMQASSQCFYARLIACRRSNNNNNSNKSANFVHNARVKATAVTLGNIALSAYGPCGR